MSATEFVAPGALPAGVSAKVSSTTTSLNLAGTPTTAATTLVDNHPTADTVIWSVLSLIALLGGIGILLAAFGRWNFLGWHGSEQQAISFRPPDEVVLTPSQRACSWFFLVMSLIFLLQVLLGAATQHYRADLSSFFGIDLARVLPFNMARTWHLQLAIFWVSTSFLAAGIFLTPMIVGREHRRQNWLAYGLLVALAIVVFGSMLGEYAGIKGWIQQGWQWFGDQGFEYLDLGRFWQVLLIVGLFFWTVILFRGLRGRLGAEHMEQNLLRREGHRVRRGCLAAVVQGRHPGHGQPCRGPELACFAIGQRRRLQRLSQSRRSDMEEDQREPDCFNALQRGSGGQLLV